MVPLSLVDHKDIQIFTGKLAFVVGNAFYCSSLDGNRAIHDVFDILDNAVAVGPSNAFLLRNIDDQGNFLSTICQRGDIGTFSPGRYMIVPQDNGVTVLRKEQETFGARSREVPHSMTAKVDDTPTEGSAASTRDDGPRGFKMRLVYRDKGCVVCHAEGTASIYQYRDDSRFFEGSHIHPFAFQSAWALRGYQDLMTDPYTATSTENATRNKRDPLRINSVENGILLCLFHHKAFDTFRFSIHPTTRKIFAFHPAVTHLHGLEVTSPWKESNSMYPGPHHELLRTHFQTSIFASLSAAVEPLELDDHDEDDEELPEIPSDRNEAVRIWASDSNRLEERDNSSPWAPKCKHVEVPQSGSPNSDVI